MRYLSIFLFLLFCFIKNISQAQFADDFSDGDFSTNPTWSGDNSKFEIDPNMMLHLTAPAVANDAVLVTPSSAINDATWEFYVKLGFNPSSNSYADVYLVADQQDLRNKVNGYFVRIGNTTDEISLYRQSGDLSQITKIIDGTDNRVNQNTSEILIKVTRDATGNWKLDSDVDLKGEWALEGDTLDNTHVYTQYFGIRCQYAQSYSDKFYFDDFSISGTPYVDNTKPTIDTLLVTGDNSLVVSFSEPVGKNLAETLTNYQLGTYNQNPTTASLVVDTAVILTFPQSFPVDDSLTLNVKNIEDIAGNILDPVSLDFVYHPPYHAVFRDVVINEIMADPNPTVDLPDAEFVELFNTTDQSINLINWQLTGAGNGTLADIPLLPGEFAILTSPGDASRFTGKVISWGSGSLLNGGEPLVLKDSTGQTIDSVFYQTDWYGQNDKMNGGWSLEQINPFTSCSDFNNWAASTDVQGGTPGYQNAIFSTLPDEKAPKILSIRATSPNAIEIQADEWLAPNVSQEATFKLDNNSTVANATLNPSRTQIALIPTEALSSQQYHQLEIKNMADCEGNPLDSTISFYFDDTPPVIDSILPLSTKRIQIFTSESLDVQSSGEKANFILNGTSIPDNIIWLNDTTLVLSFDEPVQTGGNASLDYSGLTDTLGNEQSPQNFDFVFNLPNQPGFNQLLITEIMADPSPPIQLPDGEYLELYNPTDHDFLLVDAILQIGRDSILLDDVMINAGEYIVLCTNSLVNDFSQYGHTFGVNHWPSLKNNGDTLVILNNAGEMIFSVAYSKDWIRDADKSDGGWSLEMIDANYPCSTGNWSVSLDNSGGTPDRENSVKSDKPDLIGPSIIQAFAPNDSAVEITLNEKFDPKSLFIENITVEPAIGIDQVKPVLPLLFGFNLDLNGKIMPKTQYTVTVDNLADCAGNLMTNPKNLKTFVLPEKGDSLDIVLNEILFDPRPGGVDFVEIYNRSDKYINLKNWQIAFQKDDGSFVNAQISRSNDVLDPGQYLALTGDPGILKADYPMGAEDNFLKVDQMPNLLNDHGAVFILDQDEAVIDQFTYSVDYHSPLLVNTEGVSLERIRADGPSNNPENWHSAAGSAGYATPGKQNSQTLEPSVSNDQIIIDPEVFAPGSAGMPDFTTINLHFNKTGNTASINILDVNGRKIKTVANNESLAVEGSFHWDGDDDAGHQARVGYYIVLVEITNLDGTTRIYKKKVAIGARF